MTVRIVEGDCRALAAQHGPYDLIIGDPPYGDTSLKWDKRVPDWLAVAAANLRPGGSIWMFGSMRHLLQLEPEISEAGLAFAQDIVWEKHNGSGFHADRFKRVHEHAVQFYRDADQWSQVYNDVQTTPDATARTIRRKHRPPHMGHIEQGAYESVDGGPRLMRSVIYMRSCHGHAIHRTQKPDALLEILIRTSCPAGGLVGDFFAGSGAAGVAALRAGRRYVGFELDPEMADAARSHIAGVLV